MKKFSTLLIALIAGFTSWSQCDATYGTSQNPNTGEVYLYMMDSTVTGTYVWDMGDGNVQTTLYGEIQYTYNTAGIYVACLSFDDGLGCTDAYCDTIVIDSVGTPPPSSCDATFMTWQNTSTGEYYFYTMDSTISGTYVWDFGDGNVQTTLDGDVYYTYSTPGNYLACLSFDDGLGCTDTFCDTIVVDSTGTPPTSCNANFYWWQAYDSINNTFSSDVYLVNMATGSNLTYAWSFGDGTTSNQQYPTHTYPQIGDYLICLTVDNGNGCTNSYCDTISVLAKSNGFTLNVISESEAASVGIAEEEIINFTSLYPNPVNDLTTLEVNATQNTKMDLTIIDISGKRINSLSMNVSTGSNKIAIETSQLANGYYMLNINSIDGNFTKTIRFTKQ